MSTLMDTIVVVYWQCLCGYNSFSKIKDYYKCCNYITKYITKDCVKNKHNRIYFSSRGLKKAEKIELENFDFDFKYENDYCKIRDFNTDELSREELLILINKKQVN